jgi:adenylate kinase
MIDWMPEKIPSISTGDMLRAEIAAQTPLGKKTQEIIAAGGLVNDELMNEIVKSRISQPDCCKGFMLDGYPRTLEQAEYFDTLLAERSMPAPVVIHLDVPADVVVGRIISRRQCTKCGQMYNVLSQRPKVPGQCDLDNAPLFVRKDDQEAVIRERLKTYESVTRPVLSHYPGSHYYQLHGDRSQSYIFEEITQILERVMKTRRSVAA